MRTTNSARSVAIGAILAFALFLAVALILVQENGQPQTSHTGPAPIDPSSATTTPIPSEPPSADVVSTAAYSPPLEAESLDQEASQDSKRQPLVTLGELSASEQKRIRHRIAASNLMAGLENKLQLEVLATTPEKWEEIRRTIHDADRGSRQFTGQARSVLDPMLTKLIEEGRAETDDPMTVHRVRGQHGYAVRHIVAHSRGPGTLSQSTFALRYQWGSSREVDTALEPIERELSRRSAELGNKLRSIIAREQ